MKRNIRRFTVKLTSALLLAATLMGTAATAVRADEMDAQPTECVETVVEGQGDVIDDCFAVVEGQGDIIDDCFAVAPEEAQPVEETVVETPVVEAQPVVETVTEAPAEETAATPEVEGQGDVIDDRFAVVEGQGDIIEDQFVETEGRGDIIDDEFAVAPEAEVAENTTNDLAGAGALDATILTEASLNAVGGWNFFGLFGNDKKSDLQKTIDAIPSIDVNRMDEFYKKNEEEYAKRKEEEAKKAREEEVAKAIHDATMAVRADDSEYVPESNTADDGKSDTTKDLETLNKIINPSDSKYGDKIRKKIDECDDLDDADKKYLKEMTTIIVNTSEGYGIKDMVPGAGTIKKGAKALEEISKAIDAKDTNETLEHIGKAAQNAAEGGLSLLPGGGPMMAGWKALRATQRYAAEKAASKSDKAKLIFDALSPCI